MSRHCLLILDSRAVPSGRVPNKYEALSGVLASLGTRLQPPWVSEDVVPVALGGRCPSSSDLLCPPASAAGSRACPSMLGPDAPTSTCPAALTAGFTP